MIEHNLWFSTVTNNASVREAAGKCDIPFRTLNEQLNRQILPEKTVIALARAYGISPIEALVRTGYITDEEINNRAEETASPATDDYPTWALNSHFDHGIVEAFGDIAEEVNGKRVNHENATAQISAWLDVLPASLFNNLRNSKSGYIELFETYID